MTLLNKYVLKQYKREGTCAAFQVLTYFIGDHPLHTYTSKYFFTEKEARAYIADCVAFGQDGKILEIFPPESK